MDYPKASMHTPAGHLKAPPYISLEENKAFKLPVPSSANILPLNFTPSLCQQGAQGPKALCDYKLQQRLSSQLKLSAKMKREAEAAQTNSQSTFRPVFGSNCNMIEVFFQIDSHGEHAPPTSHKATLEDTQALGSSFEQIDIGDKGFNVALDKNYKKIFVMFGAGLKLIYEDKIGGYVEKAIVWKNEEYASAGVYHWEIWMEQAHAKLESLTTKDTNVKGHMKKALLPLFKAMGAMTRAQRILLAAIDLECLQEYEKILGKCLDHRTSFETDEWECFTLRACLVNVFTEPHLDGADMKNGWASMCPLGEFEDGDFCITELKRRFVYKVGSISFLKSKQYEHFTLKWKGH
ncbi:hypothetical protein B9Z19DRAFT_1063801 [Tuber borchii]|uniref:Uncharacterized protein n=1 Tax=Tuber borchii TaxID=42251 RepID=A0A2T6ZWY8_TUBBO|nr:hypothetical protein B9Z19DRAFT_1063801 [Tuber borchii]